MISWIHTGNDFTEISYYYYNCFCFFLGHFKFKITVIFMKLWRSQIKIIASETEILRLEIAIFCFLNDFTLLPFENDVNSYENIVVGFVIDAVRCPKRVTNMI